MRLAHLECGCGQYLHHTTAQRPENMEDPTKIDCNVIGDPTKTGSQSTLGAGYYWSSKNLVSNRITRFSISRKITKMVVERVQEG